MRQPSGTFSAFGGISISRMRVQIVVVVDAELANAVLGNAEGLSKGLEPDLSDQLLSHRPGHRTMFSSDTYSPYWRLIRKGTAPAFKEHNIKCMPPSLFCHIAFGWQDRTTQQWMRVLRQRLQGCSAYSSDAASCCGGGSYILSDVSFLARATILMM